MTAYSHDDIATICEGLSLLSGTPTQLVKGLENLATELEKVEQYFTALYSRRAELVEQLRGHGLTWDDLGSLSGVSKQALLKSSARHGK